MMPTRTVSLDERVVTPPDRHSGHHPLICGPVCQVGHGEAAPGWLLGCRFVWPAQG